MDQNKVCEMVLRFNNEATQFFRPHSKIRQTTVCVLSDIRELSSHEFEYNIFRNFFIMTYSLVSGLAPYDLITIRPQDSIDYKLLARDRKMFILFKKTESFVVEGIKRIESLR